MDQDNNNSVDRRNDEMTESKDKVMSSSGTEPKIEKKLHIPGKDSKKYLFNPEQLQKALMPSLEKMCMQKVSCDFREPVDPIGLGIPDYFDIVKKPMDLSTIHTKLTNGKYSDPWQYVNDVWLMFDNAWLYNQKGSRVYRYCTSLSEIFGEAIDPVMQSLGYCCGRKYTFNPQVLWCYGKSNCKIPKGATYREYSTSVFGITNYYTFCTECFSDIPGDTFTLGDDPKQSTEISKTKFEEKKNEQLDLEPFVDCIECGRKQHQICVLHSDSIWPDGFVCDNCLREKGERRKKNKFNAKQLPQTKLSGHIETRVNDFLKKKEASANAVHIRVLSSSDKVVKVKPGMQRRFVVSGDFKAEFPYRAKALFAFQEIDGIDVCFFGMHVQEYGSECPYPNTRRVYIGFLDSVHFFEPKQHRTDVYHEILLGYLDYVKGLGYTMAHIWASPPTEGVDYIFNCHPPDQKIPKPKRLQNWYKKMLTKGMHLQGGPIHDFGDILKHAMEDKLTPADLPYFEGDRWPNEVEESIQELEQAEEQKKKQAKQEAAGNAKNSLNEVHDPPQKDKEKSQKKAKKSNKSNANQTGNDLSAKIFTTVKKYKEEFFAIRLHSTQSAASLAPIHDPDPLINCDLMDGHNSFLTLAHDKHYEFSSLRRAQYSTLCMLYDLHNQPEDKFDYTCDHCKNKVETPYHCTVCDDFDLCTICKDKIGHEHAMEKLDLDLNKDPSNDLKRTNPQDAQKQSNDSIQSLVHAWRCQEQQCRQPSCMKMKRVVAHTQICKRKTNGRCPICQQLITLCCSHAKHCNEVDCLVLYCSKIKKQLDQQAKLRHRRVSFMYNRTAPIVASQATISEPQNTTTRVDLLPQMQSNAMTQGGQMSVPSIQGNQMGNQMKGAQTPAANVLQVIKEVQEEAARQGCASIGKNLRVMSSMSPSTLHHGMNVNMGIQQQNTMKTQQQQQQQQNSAQQSQQGMVNSNQQPNPMNVGNAGSSGNMMLMNDSRSSRFPNNANQGLRLLNPQMMPQNQMQQQPQQQMMNMRAGMQSVVMRQNAQNINNQGLTIQALQQHIEKLKNQSSTNSEQLQQILNIFKQDPQLVSAFLKELVGVCQLKLQQRTCKSDSKL